MRKNPSGTVSYNIAENSLITSAYEFIEYVSRNISVSAVLTIGRSQVGDYKYDVTINNWYIPNWMYL